MLNSRRFSRTRVRVLLAALVALLPAWGATAQSETSLVSTFAGQWRSFDPAMSDGGNICTITLHPIPVDGKLTANSANCGSGLSRIAEWAIVENQIVLMDGSGAPLMRLGGNQRRLTGETTAGQSVILESRGGDGTAEALQSALNAAGCLYLGYTATCAAPAEENKPAIVEGKGNVKVLVDLNARTSPRFDASVLGVVKQDTCLVVNQCTLASDGVWCRADFNGKTGWVRKLALRQNKWPVVTYQNNC